MKREFKYIIFIEIVRYIKILKWMRVLDLNKLKKILNIEEKKVWYQRILWILGGVVLLLLTEFLLRGSLYKLIFEGILWQYQAFFVNYLLILILTSVIFITKRKYMTYFFVSTIILLAGIVTYFLMSVRGTPLTFFDLFAIKDGLAIVDKYINKLFLIIIGIIGIIAFVVIARFLYRLDSDTKRFNKVNFILLFLVVLCFCSTVRVLHNKGIMQFMRYDITLSYKYNGFVYSFADSCLRYRRNTPENYSEKEILDIKDRVDKAVIEDIRQINIKSPNVLFVQLEAFMDPTLIKDIEFSEDPIPNFRKLYQNYTSGMANVPTFGGGTVKTEFEVMTGYNIDYLTPGEVPYNTILKNRSCNSVVSTLNSQGYKTHAIHNFDKN